MAGCSVSVNVIVPKRRSTSSHPQTAPGTVTVRIPPGGMPDPGPQLAGFHLYPAAFMRASVWPLGAFPLALSAYSFFSAAM